ncbi:MAG: SDR family NAD(P)-dependent oxidoreductase [Solirubrobacteraceae bacterium]
MSDEAPVAIITGARRGIGKAIARGLHGAGHRVLLADVDEQVGATATEIDPDPERAMAFVGDLSTGTGARDLVAVAVERWGRVDVLANNAGGGVIRPFLDHDDQSIADTISRNLLTTVHCAQAVLPTMIAAGRGSIVNTGAESVRNGLAQHTMYNGAKGGVHGLTVGLAREFAARGIRVNCVAPSIVVTELVQGWYDDPSTMPDVMRPVVEEAIGDIPMGRAATVDEVAAAVVFLATDAASFITGQVVSVNGGSSML